MTARFGLLAIGAAMGFAASAGIALASPPAVVPTPAPALQRVADSDASTAHDSYLEKAQSTLDAWRHKLNASAETAGAQARATSSSAQTDLNTAWQKTQAEAKRLSAASAGEWDRARRSFEKASEDLKDSWNRAHPDDK
jgi:Skp family chaperone for outer membrane proteins